MFLLNFATTNSKQDHLLFPAKHPYLYIFNNYSYQQTNSISHTDSHLSSMGSLTESQNKIRVFMIPIFATGHLIPMTDLARQLAANPNVEPTIVTTPANAEIIRPSLATDDAANTVKILTYPFPEVGLASGIENLSTAPFEEFWRLDEAIRLSQPSQESLLRAHKPDAIISDYHFWWTKKIANDLSIPRLTFSPIGTFSQLVLGNLMKVQPEILSRKDEDPYQSYIKVPDLPGPQISLPVSELALFIRGADAFSDTAKNLVSSPLTVSGAVTNTFYDLESDYYETSMKVIDPKNYWVGPLGLNSLEDQSQATCRGGQGNKDCLSWLDKMPNQSVVFVCFGSCGNFSVEQLHELAVGLDESGKNFLWVIRDVGKDTSEEWFPEGWEERVKSRGLVIKGWVPQVAILRHESTGAFLSHCGWNSILEAMSAGMPMLTWPLGFEQFINERLVVEVKGCGVRLWEGGKRSNIENEKQVVPRQVISQALSRFMEPGGVGEMARAKAEKMARMSNDATAEDGSSRKDLYRLLDDLINAKKN